MRFIAIAVIGLLASCTTVKRNAGDLIIRNISHPPLDSIQTVGVGDDIVRQGVMIEEDVLVVHETVKAGFYTVPAKSYPKIGESEKDDFYEPDGVRRAGLADPVGALAWGKEPGSKLRVVTVFGVSRSGDGHYTRERHLSKRDNSFLQSLIYSGRIGSKINVGYREFSNNLARPAFNNDVEYDLDASSTIGYKGVRIEVIEATNSGITYRVVSNFDGVTAESAGESPSETSD